ncbi:sensor histidine kinase [Desulfuromusa kysingii]|uniref:sensor histidine kinase n=1 Tax=Desulfuromusa kysingii TaxID=37625 RepID=UPI001C31278E|nr:HAMP domain-containing sensor histidine kinase [Desulfuromusa kysingii]
MKIIKLFKSSTFRLALIYMTLFGLSVLLLLGFIYWSTAGYMVRQTEATIDAEITGLAERYDLSGFSGLKEVINERLSRQGMNTSIYLLTDNQFKPLLGNIGTWPVEQPSEQGWLSFQLDSTLVPSDHRHKALVRVFPLRDDFHLLVGRDIHALVEIQVLIREALFWGLMMTVVLALVGGFMMSRTMVHKIEVINDTCHRIMAGDLTHRIPSSGGDDDFDKLVATLNRMLDQIEILMQGVKQVTNNIAHDLRTPLSRLRRRLDMLRENDHGDNCDDELIEQAIGEADGLLATFKALLRISEVESGSRLVGFQAVDVAELLHDLIEFYDPLSEEKGQSIVLETQSIKPFQGDRDLLFQAFANVLDNAIKYTPAGGKIQIKADDNSQQLQVSICDTGIGIPPSDREKVFNRFYRRETSRSSPGNGLGLSLVEAIVNLHQGQIILSGNSPGLTVKILFQRTS